MLLFTHTVENSNSGIGITCYAITRVIKHSNIVHLSKQWNLTSHNFGGIKLHLCQLNQLLYSTRG